MGVGLGMWDLPVDRQIYCLLHAKLRIASSFICAIMCISERIRGKNCNAESVTENLKNKFRAMSICLKKKGGYWSVSYLDYRKAELVLAQAYELGEPIRRAFPGSEYGRYTLLLNMIICTIDEKREWTNECKKAVDEMAELERSDMWLHEQGSWYTHTFTAHGEEIRDRIRRLHISLDESSMKATEHFHRRRNNLNTNNDTKRGCKGQGHPSRSQMKMMVCDKKRVLKEALTKHLGRKKGKKKTQLILSKIPVIPPKEQERNRFGSAVPTDLQPITDADMEEVDAIPDAQTIDSNMQAPPDKMQASPNETQASQSQNQHSNTQENQLSSTSNTQNEPNLQLDSDVGFDVDPIDTFDEVRAEAIDSSQSEARTRNESQGKSQHEASRGRGVEHTLQIPVEQALARTAHEPEAKMAAAVAAGN